MRIKYITDVRIPTPRALGYAIMKSCEEFSKNSADVELILPNKNDSDFLGDPFDYYDISRVFRIKKISSTDLLSKTWFFGKLFYFIDLFTFLFNLKFFLNIKKEDIVYTRDFLVILSISKSKLICFEIHDIPSSKYFFKKALKKTNLFFVLNKNIKEEIVKLGVQSDKIFITPSGVDIEKFNINISKLEARRKVNLEEYRPKVIYTGHLYSWKGVEVLANAAKILPQADFVFVGGVEPEITRFRALYGTYSNIIIREFEKRELMPYYLKSADVLCVPNSSKLAISSKYTSPLKLFEYMASKRPIVVSDLPSMREILSENNALFAKSDDHSSFAETIKTAINNEEASNIIATRAFEDVKQYSWENRAKNIINHINENSF